MKAQNALGIILKFLAFLAVLGVMALSIGVFFYSFYEIIKVIKTVFSQYSSEGEVILKALKAIDLVLLGVIFFIISTGLFELFIKPIDNLPKWFQMKNIDQLKAMLIKVIIVVMGVSFTGRIVTWDGETDLLGYGVGLGIVIIALSYFLKVKNEKDESHKSM
ncbi:MAG: YqhA family protein [Bacteroidota bacterium]